MNLGRQLHRLGDWTFSHPWRVIGAWVVLFGVLASLAVMNFKAPTDALSIPGTKGQQAITEVQRLFPHNGAASGHIVFHTPKGSISDQQATIESLLTKVSKVDGVTAAISPFSAPSLVSQDGTIAYAPIQLKASAASVDKATLQAIQNDVEAARSDTLEIEYGGDLISNTPGEIIGVGEIAGVAIALMVLIITLGSLIAGGMPILSAVTAVGVTMAGLFALSKAIDINTTTPVLAVMLGLAVGIDYSLFIVNKHRRYARIGYSYRESAAKSLGTAGNAVVFAACTVIIALASLAIVQIPFMTTMGLVGAASIAVAALVSLTLTPALLGLAGARVFRRKERIAIAKLQKKTHHKTFARSHNSFWYKWGNWLGSHPYPSLVAGLVVIGIIALPSTSLVLGLPSDQYAASSSTQHKAYELLSQGFGVGFNGPLTVLVEGLPKVSNEDEAAVRQQAMAQLDKKVADETAKQQAAFETKLAAATTPEAQMVVYTEIQQAQTAGEQQKAAALTQIEQTVKQYAKYVQLKKVADTIGKLDNVASTQPALVTEDGTAGIIQVIAATPPAQQATKDLIKTLRDPATAQKVGSPETLQVTGSLAMQDDINAKLADALPLYLAVIVGLSLILLLIAFRSVLIPIKATLGFVLSVLAMFGAIVAVFQWGMFDITDAPGPIVSFVPIIATGILFGLAMDYEFFLVSSMHEAYTHGKDPQAAIVDGFADGSKIVTAAAVIMISVFAGFIGNHQAVIQSIGFGLAVGIFIDAFIVRMTIVPAIMVYLGNYAWWLPAWLDRILPHVSIEGEE